MTDSPVRLCRDCAYCVIPLTKKFMSKPKENYSEARCWNPKTVHKSVDLVSGKETITAYRCESERRATFDINCGPEGKLWEAR